MTNQHPITPPPELVEQWYDNMGPDPGPFESFAIAAARWGADQELEACCEVLAREWNCAGKHVATNLHMIRRPKPSSLKEQALETLNFMESEANYDKPMFDTIRRALEALPE